jgi:hypothetical protein
MAWNQYIGTSIHGTRMGLQFMSTAFSGGSRGSQEYLVGPAALRVGVTTAESTAVNLHPHGVSHLPGTSVGSSAVYTLDPPVPGVIKTIYGSSENGPIYVKTANNETIKTTLGTTFTTVKISTLGGGFQLMGLTTAIWIGLGLTSGTSSQASGFGQTTST